MPVTSGSVSRGIPAVARDLHDRRARAHHRRTRGVGRPHPGRMASTQQTEGGSVRRVVCRSGAFAAAALVAFLAFGTPAGAVNSKCVAGKNKCASKKMQGIL